MKNVTTSKAINMLKKSSRAVEAFGKSVLFPEVKDAKFDVGVNTDGQAWSTVQDGKHYVHVDMMLALAEEVTNGKDVNPQEALLRAKGIIAHEDFHILHTDFGAMVDICTKGADAQKSIPALVAEYRAASDDAARTAALKKAKTAISEYVKANYLKELDNSLEDAWIENIGPSYKPQTYAGVVSVRDSITRMEVSQADLSVSHESSNWIHCLITDIRHLAVIDYRQEVETPYLNADEYLSGKVDEIRELCYYARFSCSDSWEVYAVAKAILERYLKDRVEAKAKSFFDEFKKALDAGDDEEASQPQMGDMASELSIASSKKEAGGSGMSSPSEFNIELDEENKKALDEAKKETEEAKSAAESKSSAKSESADGADGEKSGDDGEKSGADSADGEKSSADADGTDSSSSDDDTAEGKTAESEAAKSVSEVKKESKAEAMRAAAAVESEVKALEKQADKAAEKALEREVFGDSGSGKSPDYAAESDVPASLSHLHDGIDVKFISANECAESVDSYPRVEESDVKKMSQRSAQFASQLKKVLMYRANDTKLFGQKSGKINTPQLFRAKTDGRVFKQVTPGKKTSARICVLVDQSGSMHGQKAYDAALASMLLAQACARVKVPVSVYGFNSPANCNLYQYIPFDGYLKYRDNLNLVKRAQGGNRDSLAYFHAAIDLAKHAKKGEKLVMIVISDGSPADDGMYYGAPAIKDLKNFISYFKKKKGISAIGVGIGDDTAHIPQIYENYSLVPDVDELPEELLKILKKIMTE